ncbi:MAG: hypothetical protein IPL53_02005 [Ignavibacteria bacterium]|nr:hypothetical protein [Ignavibacteria bacterium]
MNGGFIIKDNNNYYTPELDFFHFKNDSNIILERWTDIGTIYGIGKYSIKKNKLVIVFDSTPDSVKNFLTSSYKIIEEKFVSKDLKYDLNIIDEEMNGLETAFVSFQGNKSKSKYFSDEKGKVRIKVSHSELPISLTISYIGYETITLDLKDSLSKRINICLKNPPSDFFNFGEKLEFRIKDIHRDSFYIMSEYENVWLQYIKKY